MKKLNQKILCLNGTKKRVGEIKSIFQNIEVTVQLLHTSLISTNNCITFLYSWGHIIIYTYPQDEIITVEFLYPVWEKKVDKIIETVIQVFQPINYKIKELKRC